MVKLLTRPQLAQHIRSRVATHIVEDPGVVRESVAIYSLCDPRDIFDVRYIGQTTAPKRRFFQHIHTSRLWLPDEVPWWIKSPQLRPLYDWIRELHRDDNRLPVMHVTRWVGSVREARVVEREHICEQLSRGGQLLNAEFEVLGRQLPFSYKARDSTFPKIDF